MTFFGRNGKRSGGGFIEGNTYTRPIILGEKKEEKPKPKKSSKSTTNTVTTKTITTKTVVTKTTNKKSNK